MRLNSGILMQEAATIVFRRLEGVGKTHPKSHQAVHKKPDARQKVLSGSWLRNDTAVAPSRESWKASASSSYR